MPVQRTWLLDWRDLLLAARRIREVLRNPHWHKPRPRAEVIAALEGGFDRTQTHDGSFPAAMIERDFLIAAQRVCKELGPL